LRISILQRVRQIAPFRGGANEQEEAEFIGIAPFRGLGAISTGVGDKPEGDFRWLLQDYYTRNQADKQKKGIIAKGSARKSETHEIQQDLA
jgi:hypothetical protein